MLTKKRGENMDNRKKCCSNCRYHFLHKCENLKSNEDFKKLNMRKDCNKYCDFLKKYVCENFDSMYIQYLALYLPSNSHFSLAVLLTSLLHMLTLYSLLFFCFLCCDYCFHLLSAPNVAEVFVLLE